MGAIWRGRNLAEVVRAWHLERGKEFLDSHPSGKATGQDRHDGQRPIPGTGGVRVRAEDLQLLPASVWGIGSEPRGQQSLLTTV